MSIATEIQRLQQTKADIKTAIEKKGVTVGDGTIDTYAEKINEISAGGGSGLELVQYLKAPQFTSLNIFGKSEIVLNLDSAATLNNLCNVANDSDKNTTVKKITINCPNKITTIQNVFYCNSATRYDETLKHITFNADSQKVTNGINAFAGMVALEIIDGQPLNFSSITNANYLKTFNNTPALIDVRFVANSIKVTISFSYSDKLSTDTIQSIIDGLADLTGSTAQTLTLHATVGGKLTDEQKATITAKNWELVY